MLTASLILPHPLLRDFIYNYTLCKSDYAQLNLDIPCFANHETSLCFFRTDAPILIKNPNAKNTDEQIDKVSLFGLLTHFKGTMRFQGNCDEFIIEFKPNGFNRMFGIPATEICDKIYPANEVIGKYIKRLYMQLLDASGVQEMVSVADKFLIGFLNRQKAVYANEGITRISHQLLSKNYNIDISKYANQANMSIRNFERRFSEQIGTSPKLFCRILRFNSAVKSKITHSEKSWGDIAFDNGYYDNMHMIKEFKQFTNVSPSILFNNYSGLTTETLPNWNE
jgi:AraC-like DNA-binding protein